MHTSKIFNFVQILVLLHVASADNCNQQGNLDFRSDPDDCRIYYRCYNNVLHRSTCAEKTVFNKDLIACVHVGSDDDKCTGPRPTSSPAPTEPELNPICLSTPDSLIPHPDNCSLYYNCSAPARISRWEKNLQECDFPRVYNAGRQRCEHYTMVDCGQREEPLGVCEYKYSECLGSHCIPCNIFNPNCRGYEDGVHAHKSRPDSPYFMVCKDQRLVYTGRCLSIEGRSQLFYQPRQTCVWADELFP